MNKWKGTINLAMRWDEDWTDSNIPEMGKWVAQRIKIAIPSYEDYDLHGFELDEIIGDFENISTESEWEEINDDNVRGAELKGETAFTSTPLEEFNNVMTALYDWADSNRYWIERPN